MVSVRLLVCRVSHVQFVTKQLNVCLWKRQLYHRVYMAHNGAELSVLARRDLC
jgi:hypothetical protein